MSTGVDVRLPDGRMVVAYDARIGSPDEPALVWHHGSPHTGALYEPLLSLAAANGFRLFSYARPGYGASTSLPGRDVASAAGDVAAVADAFGLGPFAVLGASGGGPHALACAALLSDRVWAAATIASPAPYTDVFDWYAGMQSAGALLAAREGREARVTHAESQEFDPAVFVDADWEALSGEWAGLNADVQVANAASAGGLIDDDVAFAKLWGFDVGGFAAPVLVVHGTADRMVPPSHGRALHDQIRHSQLWLRRQHGHVSVLRDCGIAMEWLRSRQRSRD